MGFADDGCGDTGAPPSRSGKTEPLMSREKGLAICGGPMMDVCHMELVAAVAVWWFEPSTMTSLMPLWLVVLSAEGEEPSTAFSIGPPLLNDIVWSKPVTQSKSSSDWLAADMSGSPCGNGERGSMAIEGGESL
jgi:hypothetical protein